MPNPQVSGLRSRKGPSPVRGTALSWFVVGAAETGAHCRRRQVRRLPAARVLRPRRSRATCPCRKSDTPRTASASVILT